MTRNILASLLLYLMAGCGPQSSQPDIDEEADHWNFRYLQPDGSHLSISVTATKDQQPVEYSAVRTLDTGEIFTSSGVLLEADFQEIKAISSKRGVESLSPNFDPMRMVTDGNEPYRYISLHMTVLDCPREQRAASSCYREVSGQVEPTPENTAVLRIERFILDFFSRNPGEKAKVLSGPGVSTIPVPN